MAVGSLLRTVAGAVQVVGGVLVLGVVLFGLLCFYRAGRVVVDWIDAKAGGRSGPVRPAAAQTGDEVAVTGAAAPGPEGTLRTPVSDDEAVAYRLVVEQRSPEVGWWTVADGGTVADCRIEGSAESVTVDTAGGIEIEPESVLEVAGDEGLPADVRERLAATPGINADDGSGLLASAVDERRRYAEGTVSTGEQVSVYGACRETSDGIEIDAETLVRGDRGPGEMGVDPPALNDALLWVLAGLVFGVPGLALASPVLLPVLDFVRGLLG